MTGKRSHMEIEIEVLKTIGAGETLPTRIMYKSNLSWRPLHKMLGEMLERGLIEVAPATPTGRRHYSITDKGREAIRSFSWVERVLNGM